MTIVEQNMISRFAALPGFVLICLGLSGAMAQAPATTAPDLKDPVVLLKVAQAMNGLSSDDLKPWHLKASYEVFDDFGKPLGKGIFEEWWAANDRCKQSFTGDHYTGATYHSAEGMARERDTAWPEIFIADALVSPITPKIAEGLTPKRAKAIPHSDPPLWCMEIPIRHTAEQMASPNAYCFDAGTAILRLRKSSYVISALKALRTYRFKPAERNGQAISTSIFVEVNFHLR